MSDEDYTTAAGASKASGPGSGKHRGPRFTWNPQYEATFFHSLCESVHLGLRDGSTFKPEAWERATQALIEKHNAYANKSHLINKTDNARKKYRLWRGLREDPEFFYNAQTRTVTATEDAWARHLQKEPLARSLKNRPFDHEDYYAILFPDVIGSGGAPKRLTKPRRKGQDSINGAEEQDAPGAGIMDLLADHNYINPTQTHIPPPLPAPAMPTPMPPIPSPTQQLSRAPPTSMPPPPPPRSSVSSTSALTPPEETALQSRKRLQAPEGNASSGQADKRRRTVSSSYIDLSQQQHQAQNHQSQSHHHHHQSHHHQAVASTSNSTSHNTPNGVPQPTTSNSNSNSNFNGTISPLTSLLSGNANGTGNSGPNLSLLPEGILLLAEALAAHQQRKTGGGRMGTPSNNNNLSSLLFSSGTACWQEQAMDIFFRDFAGEDMDLQLKIAEKVLADENKAMVFCKMPDVLRRHWVKRLREVHNRIA